MRKMVLLWALVAFQSYAQVVHIVSTTDLHGRLLPQKNATGELFGGMDLMAGYFDIAKQIDSETLFLDSGDMFQGTIISNSHEGEAVVRWMNYVGYTAAVIGNHEFDFGPQGASTVATQVGQDPLGALKKSIEGAKFKFLAANICSVEEDQKGCQELNSYQPASFAKPYFILEVHGVKLGLIGLITTLTPTVTLPSNVSKLKFMPLAEVLERFIPELSAQGVAGIIVMAHEGNDSMFQVIDALKPETRQQISLVLAGHSHNIFSATHQGVQVLIAGSYAQAFAYVTLQVDSMSKKLQVEQTEIVHFKPDGNFVGKKVQENPEASRILASDIQEAKEISSQVVGLLKTPLTKTDHGESTLGNFMVDAFRFCQDVSCQGNAEIAILNNGGIRRPFLEAGLITYGDVFELMPFDNVYTELSLSGRQIHDLVSDFYAYKGDAPIPHVSGLKITYAPLLTKTRWMINAVGETKTIPDPVELITLSNGQAFKEEGLYRVVLSDFLATGGGSASFVLKGISVKPNYERKMRDQLVDYFRLKPTGWDYQNLERRIN